MCSNDDITEKLIISIRKFDTWLEKHGYESFDPYDIWGTAYSLWARRLYYKNSLLGLPFVAPILLIDTFIPGLRPLMVKKERFATADAQLLLAFINLYQCLKKNEYLDKAKNLGTEILSYSIPGYSGYCWGYPFDWQNSGALWRKNTPYITATPYCFEAYCALYDCTGDGTYLDIAKSIARFVADDLKETPTGQDAAAGSYSPIDNSKVINASAYRAMVLIEASERFGDAEYRKKGLRNINFILQSQNSDGSWPYDVNEKKRSFIDHFHTCFVLKNLWKLNGHLNDRLIDESIKKGFEYYRKTLFRPDDTPRPFSIEPRFQIVTNDLYNYAEAITLCSVLANDVSGALFLANKLAHVVCTRYQLKHGDFVTKEYLGGVRTTFPFLRWSQAQVFYSLTNLLMVASGNGKKTASYA
jgi:hypothetical protein